MKIQGPLLLLMLIISRSHAQEPSSIQMQDTVKDSLFKKFHWTEKSPGEFEIVVPGYDTLKKGNTDFQNFFYTTKDKPDGNLTVLDGKGNKVRECVYRNQL